LNTIGDPNCRPQYLEALRDYYRDKLHHVCPDCQERFERNPLRMLDCKMPQCQPVIAGAPAMTNYLCDKCAKHFADLKSYLEAVGIPYALNPRLVRGLDYYTRTVFEVQPKEEGGQSSIGGGGRYDGLIEMLGGRPTPGIGFGTGIERIILNLKRQEVAIPSAERTQVLIAYQTPAARTEAFRLASELRRAGIAATASTGERSLKAQMRHADGIGARYAAIIGERELAEGVVTLKRLDTGEQELVSMADVAGRWRVDKLGDLLGEMRARVTETARRPPARGTPSQSPLLPTGPAGGRLRAMHQWGTAPSADHRGNERRG
jgi:histidyl-tRNA synthetase